MQPGPEEGSNLIHTLLAEPGDEGLPLTSERREDREILSAHPVNHEAEV